MNRRTSRHETEQRAIGWLRRKQQTRAHGQAVEQLHVTGTNAIRDKLVVMMDELSMPPSLLDPDIDIYPYTEAIKECTTTAEVNSVIEKFVTDFSEKYVADDSGPEEDVPE